MIRAEKLFLVLAISLFGFTAGAPARAELALSQSPLFLIAPVQPSLIMAVDDSGSMDAEILFDTNDGAMWWDDGFTSGSDVRFNGNEKYFYLFPNGTGTDGRTLSDGSGHFAVPPLPQFAYARSPEFNGVYFDPGTDYPPWPSEGTTTFGDANPRAANADPVRPVEGKQTWDLTEPRRQDENNWVFQIQPGMTIPAGTRVDDADEASVRCLKNDLNWDPLPEDFKATAACRIGIEYFPATFWLKESTPAPTGFVGEAKPGGKAPDGTAMLGYEITPDNFSNYKEMIQSFANWFQYYRKRVHLGRAAMGRSFKDTSFLRLGFTTINDRDNVEMKDLSNQGDRQQYFDWQYALDGNGGTPNVKAVKHIGEQFERGGDNAPILQSCQRNFGMLVTDGFYSDSASGAGNADGGAGSPLAGTVLADSMSNTIADWAYSFYNTRFRASDFEAGQVPVPSACNQGSPSLSLDCNEDLHMNFFGVMLGAKGRIFGRDESVMQDPFNNPPDWPTSIPSRDPSTIDDVWHAALNTRGEAFSATRPDELVDALTSVLSEIASRIEPVGVSATSTRLDEDTQFFESELDSTTWSGNLRAIDANENRENWNAENRLPSPVDRNIFTQIEGSQVEFATTAKVRTAVFGGSAPIGSDELARQDSIINYLRGSQIDEQPNGPLRERDGVIGDIANSRPTFIGPVNEGWGRLDKSYFDYIDPETGGKKDLKTVLVGANDGMLHAFDSDSGREKFAYVPSMVHENLAQLADPDYVHRFYVDGQIGIGDVPRGGWTTVAVAGLGAGGKGVFALDVKTQEILWEIDADNLEVGPYVGHVFGKPVVTRAGGEWVVVFGNGYNSQEGEAGLIVATISGRGVPTKAQFIPTNSDSDNGLSEVAVFMDPVDPVNALRAYAGDLKGNMWRFDFNGGTYPGLAFSGGNPLIQTDDNRPITSGPTLAALPGGGIMVFFGSGKLLETKDRVGDASEFDRFWAVRDRNNRFTNTNGLAEATMISAGSGNRAIAGVEEADDGWVLDLGIDNNETGERVLSRPVVTFGRLVFTTFEPDNDPCAPGGIRRIYLLNALNASGQFDNEDCINCGVIELGLGAPIDPAIIIRPPGANDRSDGNDPPFNPGGEDGTLPDDSTVGSVTRWCSTLLIQVPGEGQVPIGNICDGRQVWRQAK